MSHENYPVRMTVADYQKLKGLLRRNADRADTLYGVLGEATVAFMEGLAEQWRNTKRADDDYDELREDALRAGAEERFEREERQRFEQDMRID